MFYRCNWPIAISLFGALQKKRLLAYKEHLKDDTDDAALDTAADVKEDVADKNAPVENAEEPATPLVPHDLWRTAQPW